MIYYASYFAVACFGIGSLICLWVVATAKHLSDRVLALDSLVINALALLVLYGAVYGTEVYFEAVMIIAMLGFVSTVAYARFILRGNIIE